MVLSSDANYAMPMAVAICSAAACCNRERALEFTVIQRGIEPALRDQVESSLRRTGAPRAHITWLEAPVRRIEDLRVVHSNHTSLIYGRLLIPELLPDVRKALYLDCDLVVLGDLAELWDTTFENRSLLAVRDRIGYVGAPSGISNHRELGIPANAKYFNSGVLLMNLDKWRASGTTERVFEYLRKHRDVILMEDQEALNAVLFDDWGELDFRWNWQIPWRSYRLGRARATWEPDPGPRSVVHFATSEKPWLPGCDYEERSLFFEALDRTAWEGWRVPWWAEVMARSRRRVSEALADRPHPFRRRAITASGATCLVQPGASEANPGRADEKGGALAQVAAAAVVEGVRGEAGAAGVAAQRSAAGGRVG